MVIIIKKNFFFNSGIGGRANKTYINSTSQNTNKEFFFLTTTHKTMDGTLKTNLNDQVQLTEIRSGLPDYLPFSQTKEDSDTQWQTRPGLDESNTDMSQNKKHKQTNTEMHHKKKDTQTTQYKDNQIRITNYYYKILYRNLTTR